MTERRAGAPGMGATASPIGAVGKVGLIRSAPPRKRPRRTVPRDGALPHLAEALDVTTMRTVFQRMLYAAPPSTNVPVASKTGFEVRRCEIEWAMYRPGKNCTVAYRVGLRDRSTGQESEQLLCARVFEPGRSLARFQAVRAEDLVSPGVGRPITHLPDMDMIVWAFPNDSKLHAMPRILDADRLRGELLPAVVEAAAGPGWSITGLRRDVVQYVPEETCTVRVRARLERVQSGERREVVVYGKIYKEGQGADTYGLMRQLWESDARRRGQLRIARPLGYDRELHILWQSGVPGVALLEENLTGPHAHSLMARAANAVAALHTADVSCSRSIEPADARSRLQEMRGIIPQITPSCRATLEPLVDRLMEQGEKLGDQPVAVLHGDLRLRHLIVDGDEVSLIDVDTLCHGSPWHDIGSFTAAILYKGMLMGLPDREIHDILATFHAHYARGVPWKPSSAVVNWYTAVALINERAFRSITRLQRDTLQMVDELVELASRISRRKGIPPW
jgi:hypothetical protein